MIFTMSLWGVFLTFFMASLPSGAGQEWFDLSPHRPKVSPRILSNSDHWMAIVGDSGVTGAASNELIEPRAWNLIGHALDFALNPQMIPARKTEPMTRVLYSQREFAKAQTADRVVSLNLEAKASLTLDIQEHSFGYMVGRALGIAAQDIVLVGQDGKRVASIPHQFERIYEMETATLPPLILVSYTANNFCHTSIFKKSLQEIVQEFTASLEESWSLTEPWLKAHRNGTLIAVLAPLEVANILTREGILTQKINLQGVGSITCRQMRDNENLAGFLTQTTIAALGEMCPSVLQTKPSDKNRLKRIVEVQENYSQVWRKQIAALNLKYSTFSIRWKYIEGTRHIEFSSGDVANDCFHPSVRGHAKIADLILKSDLFSP